MASAASLATVDVWSLFDVASATDQEGLAHYLERMLERIADWFRASGASVFLAQADDRSFLVAATTGAQRAIPPDARLYRGRGIAGEAIVRGKPMLIGDPRDDPILRDMGVAVREDIGSSMVIPLQAAPGGIIGVLSVSRPPNDTEFTRKDLIKASTVAKQIGLAVANARLFARTNTMMAETRALHETLSAVIASAGMGLLVVSPAGSIIECNPEAASFLGQRPTGAEYWESVVDRLPEAIRERFREGIASSLQGLSDRFRIADPGADRAWSVTCNPLPSGGATATVHELTEDERRQRELQRIQRLAEIGQMTAAIAHEIRNPLTGICSAAHVVRQEPAHAEEFARMIEAEALKLNALCDEFLEFARPLQLRPAPGKLSELGLQVAERCEQDFARAGVRLEIVREDAGPEVAFDRARMEQVLRNLLRNALEACREGGTVRLTLGAGWFRVQDDGEGVPADVAGRLFTPFFTTKPKGTGLGLSTVRKIVDGHGGAIEVDSEPGRGTSVTVRLPQEGAA
jgi:signal transduction histidine kinase